MYECTPILPFHVDGKPATSTLLLWFWGIPKWLKQAWPCPAVPQGFCRTSHATSGEKRTPLIPNLYDLNGCRVSFFSISSANGAWWIAFHVRWQHSPLNVSDLVCFVSHTYPAQSKWDWWRPIYVGLDVLRLHSLAYRLVQKTQNCLFSSPTQAKKTPLLSH